jgi:hypothetical protein
MVSFLDNGKLLLLIVEDYLYPPVSDNDNDKESILELILSVFSSYL